MRRAFLAKKRRLFPIVFYLAVTSGTLLNHGAERRPEPNRSDSSRLRLIMETDAGGDPDDEQSLVRFLLYVNEWDVEGIIANRARARDGENLNPERTGLGIVQAQLRAYGQCWTNLVQHDARYPNPAQLTARTFAGHNETDEAVNFILATVDREDPR